MLFGIYSSLIQICISIKRLLIVDPLKINLNWCNKYNYSLDVIFVFFKIIFYYLQYQAKRRDWDSKPRGTLGIYINKNFRKNISNGESNSIQ